LLESAATTGRWEPRGGFDRTRGVGLREPPGMVLKDDHGDGHSWVFREGATSLQPGDRRVGQARGRSPQRLSIFTTSTLQGACVTTWLATLPINSLANPVRP